MTVREHLREPPRRQRRQRGRRGLRDLSGKVRMHRSFAVVPLAFGQNVRLERYTIDLGVIKPRKMKGIVGRDAQGGELWTIGVPLGVDWSPPTLTDQHVLMVLRKLLEERKSDTITDTMYGIAKELYGRKPTVAEIGHVKKALDVWFTVSVYVADFQLGTTDHKPFRRMRLFRIINSIEVKGAGEVTIEFNQTYLNVCREKFFNNFDPIAEREAFNSPYALNLERWLAGESLRLNKGYVVSLDLQTQHVSLGMAQDMEMRQRRRALKRAFPAVDEFIRNSKEHDIERPVSMELRGDQALFRCEPAVAAKEKAGKRGKKARDQKVPWLLAPKDASGQWGKTGVVLTPAHEKELKGRGYSLVKEKDHGWFWISSNGEKWRETEGYEYEGARDTVPLLWMHDPKNPKGGIIRKRPTLISQTASPVADDDDDDGEEIAAKIAGMFRGE